MSLSLTVIVPVYNEHATVDALLRHVMAAPYPDKQVVIVDDGSSDGTGDVLRCWRAPPQWIVVRHPVNRGKGAAVRTGLAHALGAVPLIQDADLEYDPDDYPLLVEPILRGAADVVYGSRYLKRTGLRWSLYRLA